MIRTNPSLKATTDTGSKEALAAGVSSLAELVPNFSQDLADILTKFPEQATLLDVFFAYRLLLRRGPESPGVCHHHSGANLKALTAAFLHSVEYRATDPFGIEPPEIPVMAERVDGLRAWFYLRDCHVGWHWAAGNYDASQTQAIRNCLRPGFRCIDLGANIGAFTLEMGSQVGPGGMVFAFEPFPKNFSLLQRNIAENGMEDWVEAFPYAAHASSGKIRFFFDRVTQSDYWAAFASAQDQPGTFDSIEVQCVRIDDMIPPEEKIDLIKMDIEGAEFAAVEGMQRILSESRPMILFEFNPPMLKAGSGSDPGALLERLHGFGYSLVLLETFAAGKGTEFEYDAQRDQDKVVNLVAVP